MKTANLEKLVLVGYTTNDKRAKPKENEKNLPPDKRKFSKTSQQFEAQINPASINVVIGGSFNPKGTEIKETEFSGYNCPKLTFDLYLDATGAYGEVEANYIPKKIEEFKTVCYYYVGDTHDAPYVKILWGEALMKYRTLDFIYRLETLTVNYTLFDSSGLPLRAKLSCAFIGDMNLTESKKLAGKSSPDLTHLITVKAGDSLPNLCMEIYGKPEMYHHIARFNKLSNFRKLEPGQELEFPPIKNN
jgi:nucleoid-associated protein YgaU